MVATLEDVAARTGSVSARYWADYLLADPDRRAPAPRVTDRPVIRIEPGMRFGGPHLRGISTEAIAGAFLAGESADAVADDYDLTLHELWVVLWFEGTHGCRANRRALGGWSEAVYGRLVRGDAAGIEAPAVV